MQPQQTNSQAQLTQIKPLAPADERLYRAYVRDRSDGMSHAQIVTDACYGAMTEEFGLRYSTIESQYLDAMKQRRNDNYGLDPSPIARFELAPDGRTFRPGE